MLFNTLSNLRGARSVPDPDRATFMLDRMTAYLRATLSGSRTSTHALQANSTALRDYLDTDCRPHGAAPAVRAGAAGRPGAAAGAGAAVAALVENSILHGLEPAIAGGCITVRAQAVGSQLQLLCARQRRRLDTSHAGPGFGLVHVRERLRTLYGDAAQLQYSQPETGGVLACITLPLTP